MKTSAPPAAPKDSGVRSSVVLLLVASVVSCVVIGELADSGPRAARAMPSEVERPTLERVVAFPVAPVERGPVLSRLAQPAPVLAAPVAAVQGASSDLVKRAADEAAASIDALRRYIVSSCWPAAAAGATAKLTFNLTFDAQGREIARDILEGRRASAPAREFGRCLRQLDGTTLAIAPPGANVGVSIPVSFP